MKHIAIKYQDGYKTLCGLEADGKGYNFSGNYIERDTCKKCAKIENKITKELEQGRRYNYEKII